MANSNVVTARGDILNLDNLIMQANRPLNYKEEKSESTRQRVDKTPPLNIRGYMPSAPSVTMPVIADEIKTILSERATASSFSATGVAQSMADLTGIKVEKATYMNEVRKNLPEGVTPKDIAESIVVEEILNNMKSSHPNATSAAADIDKKQGIRKHLAKIAGDDVTDLTAIEENS